MDDLKQSLCKKAGVPVRGTSFFDYRSLAAFRILFGSALLLNLYMRAAGGRLDAFYTESGILPLSLIEPGDRWSFLDSFSTHNSIRVAFALIGFVYFAYTLGLFTRYMKWIVLLCLLSLYHRNMLLDDGSDWSMRLFALWTAFLPLGRVWSLDAKLFRGSRLAHEPECRYAAIGICCNLAVAYLLNVLQKTGDGWSTGDAVRRVLWDP
jgi:hypothetical protein